MEGMMNELYYRNGIPLKPFNRDMFTIACDIRRLTLDDIHEHTGIKLDDLERFNMFYPPNRDQINAIRLLLRFPIAWFYREGKRYPTWIGYHEDES
jgi:hypothetical protein